MFYVIRVNAAIAGLGIDPPSVPTDLRQAAQEMGKSVGATPQETAFILVAQLPAATRGLIDYRVAKLWVTEGRIRMGVPAIQAAASILGFEDWP